MASRSVQARNDPCRCRLGCSLPETPLVCGSQAHRSRRWTLCALCTQCRECRFNLAVAGSRRKEQLRISKMSRKPLCSHPARTWRFSPVRWSTRHRLSHWRCHRQISARRRRPSVALCCYTLCLFQTGHLVSTAICISHRHSRRPRSILMCCDWCGASGLAWVHPSMAL